MDRLNGQGLRPGYDRVKAQGRFWEHKLRRIKDRAERMQREWSLKEHPRPS